MEGDKEEEYINKIRYIDKNSKVDVSNSIVIKKNNEKSKPLMDIVILRYSFYIIMITIIILFLFWRIRIGVNAIQEEENQGEDESDDVNVKTKNHKIEKLHSVTNIKCEKIDGGVELSWDRIGSNNIKNKTKNITYRILYSRFPGFKKEEAKVLPPISSNGISSNGISLYGKDFDKSYFRIIAMRKIGKKVIESDLSDEVSIE